MPTNMTNMTILKSPEYSCLRICSVDDVIIDRIYTCSKLIFQHESNKHHTKTGNQKHTAQRRKIKTNKVVSETTKSQKQTENM